MDHTDRVREWTMIVPVKRAAHGKTRLRVPGVDHEVLARAIALDTVHAAVGSDAVARVLVVTSDEDTAGELRGVDGVRIVWDRGDGLSAAIARGVGATLPDRPRAVLLGDLPALRPHELTVALTAAEQHPLAFVPDADRTGTVLATARAGVPLLTRFGPSSAAVHRASGFVELPIPVNGLRRDLDVAAHLPALERRGLGPRTASVLSRRLALVS